MVERGTENAEKDETARLLAALCSLSTPEEARAFLADLCTAREIDDLSQRLAVASMLSAGASYVDGPAGGYRMVLARIGDEA